MNEKLQDSAEIDSAVLENAVKIETSDALKQASEELGKTVEVQMTQKALSYMKKYNVSFKTLREKFAESGADSYKSTKNILFAIYTPDGGEN